MIGLGPRRSTHTWRPYLGGRWDRDDPGHHPEIPWYHAAIHPDDKNALNKLFRLEEMGPRTRRTSKEDRLGQLWLEGGSFRCAPIPVPRRHMGTEDPHRQYRLQGGSRICGATPDRKKPGQRAGPVWEHRHASFRARGPPGAQDDLRQCSLSPPGFDLRRGPHTVSADACMTTRRVRTGEGLRRSVSPSRQGNPPQTWTPRTAHRATTYISPCTHMYFIFVCYRSKVDVLLHWPRGGRRKLWWPDATTVYCTTRAPPLSRPDTRLWRNIRHNPACNTADTHEAWDRHKTAGAKSSGSKDDAAGRSSGNLVLGPQQLSHRPPYWQKPGRDTLHNQIYGSGLRIPNARLQACRKGGGRSPLSLFWRQIKFFICFILLEIDCTWKFIFETFL